MSGSAPQTGEGSGYTDAQLIGAIAAALRASDMPAVVGLLKMLAVQNPREAEIIYDAIMLLATDAKTVVERRLSTSEAS
jgi:hypothetical protein